MATLEEILAQYLQPPVLPSEAVAAPADTSGMTELFNTQATEQQRLDSLKAGVASGAVKPNAALITQANALQTQSDEKEAAYTKSVDMIDSMLEDVNALLKDGAYKAESGQYQALADTIFGNTSKGLRGVYTGGESLGVRKRLNSLASKVFLKNYEQLKGAGAISNAESERAQAAMSLIFGKEVDGTKSIDLGISEEDMKKALLDFQTEMKKGQERLKKGLRWDEKAGKAIDAAEWREKYAGDPKATGALPTEADGEKYLKNPDFPAFTDTEDYKPAIAALPPSSQFYYNGLLYKKDDKGQIMGPYN